MRLHISSSNGVPIYLQILNQIKYQVASGRLAPGEQMPTVRKLAEDLTVNPNTVARAYRELVQAGVLSARQGAGVFVTNGGSPLARREQLRILNERMDALLAEAQQMNFDFDQLLELMRQRSERMRSLES